MKLITSCFFGFANLFCGLQNLILVWVSIVEKNILKTPIKKDCPANSREANDEQVDLGLHHYVRLKIIIRIWYIWDYVCDVTLHFCDATKHFCDVRILFCYFIIQLCGVTIHFCDVTIHFCDFMTNFRPFLWRFTI